ncbi:MAG: acyl-CoA/acyl-ACP dehydrogenase [Acidobacteria bacterium]|nr:acyl-CoA/acyl-ACP dehydrogenase [Acidobacteriota bacterium]
MSNSWKLNEEGLRILAAVDRIAREVIEPRAATTDKEGRFPRENIDAMRNAGLLGLLSAKEMGGQGQGIRSAVAVAERIARDCPSTAMITIMHNCATTAIEHFGTEDLRKAVATRGQLATLAFSETGSRSHFWVPVGTAERNGNGIRLNGSKQLITAAGKCDLYVWSSKPVAAQGLSTIWAVPSDAKGLTISAPFDGLGLRGNGSAPITARDVLVSESSRLGEDGKGFDVMMGVILPYFNVQSCAVSLGMMEGALARAVQHVTNSRYSYDSSKIADLPQVRGHIARSRVKIDLVRGFLLDAVEAVEQQRDDVMLRVLESKVAGAETSLEVLDLAMRVCGGAAFRKDVAVERFFRDSRAATVMAPVTDALYDFIGKSTCGMPLF